MLDEIQSVRGLRNRLGSQGLVTALQAALVLFVGVDQDAEALVRAELLVRGMLRQETSIFVKSMADGSKSVNVANTMIGDLAFVVPAPSPDEGADY